jgi:hypothetical protein
VSGSDAGHVCPIFGQQSRATDASARELRAVLARGADLKEPFGLLIEGIKVLVVDRPPISLIDTLSVGEVEGCETRHSTSPLI